MLLWVWMAWANNKGSSWARIVATGLFALNTISLIVGAAGASIAIIFVALGWLAGVAVVLLWRQETTAYVSWSPAGQDTSISV